MFDFSINDNLGIYKYYPDNDALEIKNVLNYFNNKTLIINRHNAEELIYDYLQALTKSNLFEYFNKYKFGDVLIVDDIHFLHSNDELNHLIVIVKDWLKENKKVFLTIDWWDAYDRGILDYIEKSLKLEN
ncbi:MAG: hypothetical protein IKI95_08345 [Clostridia bacterium]|nr:hypothetical protein [Clostridia bacterium]